MAGAKLKLLIALTAGALLTAQASAAPVRVDPAWHNQMMDIWQKMIAIPTVQGRGQIPAMTAYIADLLRKGGFAPEDIIIEGSGDSTYLAARYRGTGKGKAILLSGHMDVVEALPSDWQRDPFTPVIENGFLYGRGSYDTKFGDAAMVSTLIQLKQAGFRPRRDIVLVLSGDEETAMATTQKLATRFAPEAELVVNTDSGNGMVDAAGRPVAYMLQAAEKTYADFEIAISDPGGHSSRPTASNAIYRLSRAIDRIAAYTFPAQADELTRAYFRATGKQVGGTMGSAMLRFADDATDKAAIATLRASPEYVGQVGTTCVATMLSGGHALNALPQKASVSVNCRIFPGVSIDSVKATLARVIDDPTATIATLGSPLASDGSPLRPDVLKAVRKGLDLSYPGMPIVPQMSVGASDSIYFRALGVPSYGISGVFINPDDDFTHGLNERVPLASVDPGLLLIRTVIVELSK